MLCHSSVKKCISAAGPLLFCLQRNIYCFDIMFNSMAMIKSVLDVLNFYTLPTKV